MEIFLDRREWNFVNAVLDHMARGMEIFPDRREWKFVDAVPDHMAREARPEAF